MRTSVLRLTSRPDHAATFPVRRPANAARLSLTLELNEPPDVGVLGLAIAQPSGSISG